jgi:hypothetical protein
MIAQTFQQIMADIEDSTIITTSNNKLFITRQHYIDIVNNSDGNVSLINLPLMSINIINYTVSYFNFNPEFPFVVSDYTTANDWVTYTLPD